MILDIAYFIVCALLVQSFIIQSRNIFITSKKVDLFFDECTTCKFELWTIHHPNKSIISLWEVSTWWGVEGVQHETCYTTFETRKEKLKKRIKYALCKIVAVNCISKKKKNNSKNLTWIWELSDWLSDHGMTCYVHKIWNSIQSMMAIMCLAWMTRHIEKGDFSHLRLFSQ